MNNEANLPESPVEQPADALAYIYSNPIFLLRRTDQRAVALFNRRARHLKLTLPQSHILFIASEVGAFPQVELARQAATNEASASAAIAYLVERGLVRKVADPNDGRRNVIEATAVGRALVEVAKPIQRASLAELEAPLGDRAEEFRSLLAEVVSSAGRNVPFPEGLPPRSLEMLEMIRGSTHFLVRQAIQLLELATRAGHARYQVTLRQYVVLLSIVLMPHAGESRIATTIGLDLSNASFILRGLATKKLVDVDHSQRRRRYTATALGRELVAEAQPVIENAALAVFAGISAEKRRTLLTMLGEIIATGPTVGVPLAFDRIRKRPDWPLVHRPTQFNQLVNARQAAVADGIPALLRQAADIAASGIDHTLGLESAEVTALETILGKILTRNQAAGPVPVEGK